MYTLGPLPPEHWGVKKNIAMSTLYGTGMFHQLSKFSRPSILNYAYWLKKGVLHSPEAETLLTVLLK